ncbi:MAG TPA: nitroreductase family protein [Acidimicrobiales bacterium]|nr:nitroreductase family protein [Acidimicrobiales bacterium]
MEFFELAHRQRAYRFLEPDPVPEELIEQILDVATKAPSAQNTQPWEFIVVQDPAVRGRLADHTRHLWESFARDYSRPDVDTYQWSHTDEWASGAFARAPVVIVVCGDTRAMDAALLGSSIFPAVQNILLAALALGLGSLMSTLPIVSAREAREILDLPEHLLPMATVPIGRPSRRLGPPRRIPFADKTHRDRHGVPWREG